MEDSCYCPDDVWSHPDDVLHKASHAYQVQSFGHQPSGSGRSKPYYGNYVQQKLTVRTLGQAVWTPSGILVITFSSNIGLGRNQRLWKAKKKFCKLNIRTAINRVWTVSVRTERFYHPDGPAENSRITFQTRKIWPVRTALAPVRTRIPQNAFLT
jgi:hypothetical protein